MTNHCLITCRNGGGRSGTIYDMNDINVYLGRQRRGGALKQNSMFHRRSLFCSTSGFMNIHNSNTQINTARKGLKCTLSKILRAPPKVMVVDKDMGGVG